ncbi:MAG: DNA translocase FtsK 4TM domain-containing protein [Christensenellales bacterium]|jgi:S-DNA-T family DNA segregation ATPase FtsK/SpoIIIE
MTRAGANTPKRNTKALKRKRRLEITGVVLLALSLLLGLSVYTDTAGVLGAMVKDFSFGVLGMAAYALPVCMLMLGLYVIITAGRKKPPFSKRLMLTVCMVCILSILHLFTTSGLSQMEYSDYLAASYTQAGMAQKTGAGFMGALLAFPAKVLFGAVGAIIVFATVLIVCIIVLTQFSPQKALENGTERVKRHREQYREERRQKKLYIEQLKQEASNQKTVAESEQDIRFGGLFEPLEKKAGAYEAADEIAPEPVELPIPASPAASDAPHTDLDIKHPEEEELMRIRTGEPGAGEYIKPDINLLKLPSVKSRANADECREKAVLLEDTLASFGVQVNVVRVEYGPAITRYELTPAPGVKVNRIVNLSDDLSLAMAAPVRIEAPVPGKPVVGIEVPNTESTGVLLREVIESKAFVSAQEGCCFAVGKDITGKNIVADITRMPHLLVAGTTGSGKSVCINSIIVSMLYKYSPEQVRMIMVDPKVVELNEYNGIPHLLLPVVTDMKKAAGVLKWAVNEMTDRYKLFAAKGVRDLKDYNELARMENEPTAPQIIVIVEELADLMMVSPKDVEDAICRIAQMGRASGIHLILAAQRPSVDVVTGLIKANIPSRIALKVFSQVDSRTMLDMGGAEKLLGNGDMLYYPNGASKPIRVQGCYVSNGEIKRVTGFLKKTAQADYRLEILENIPEEGKTESESAAHEDGADELLPSAVQIVLDNGQASISMLQRRLRVGYARAARLVDEMEVRGIVSGFDGSKSRDVLITRDEAERMFPHAHPQ